MDDQLEGTGQLAYDPMDALKQLESGRIDNVYSEALTAFAAANCWSKGAV